MLTREVFIRGINSPALHKRHWVMSLFSETSDSRATDPYDYQVRRSETQVEVFDPEVGDFVAVEDGVPGEPLLHFRQPLTITAGEVLNYTKTAPLATVYGTAFINQLLLGDVFGDEFPYVAGNGEYFDLDTVTKQLEPKLVDDPADPTTPREPGKVYVRDYTTFCDRALSLVAYNNIAVRSVTPKSMLGHPMAQQLRNELMAKFAGQLSDPAVIARIGSELEALDREWLKDDPSMDFYLNKKYFNDIRSRLYYMFGGEDPFGDGTAVTFIPKSLSEGIDIDQLPVLINSIREGSYNRGRMTQLGGETTKTIYRMLGTTRVAIDDCETTLTNPMYIPPKELKHYVGFWIKDSAGNDVVLTNDNIDAYAGKTVAMRDPGFCKADGPNGRNVCRKCIGEVNAEIENGIPSTSAQFGGRLLTIFLKSMHSSSLTTARYDKDLRIRD